MVEAKACTCETGECHYMDHGDRIWNAAYRSTVFPNGGWNWNYPQTRALVCVEIKKRNQCISTAEYGPVQRHTDPPYEFPKAEPAKPSHVVIEVVGNVSDLARKVADAMTKSTIAHPPAVNIDKIATEAGWHRMSESELAYALFATDKTIAAEIARRAERTEEVERCLGITWGIEKWKAHREECERMAKAVFARMQAKP